MSGTQIKLLLDEHIWEGLAEALVQRGYDVVHLNHTPHRSIDDEPLLTLAAAEGRAVLTNNIRDFVPLIRLWYQAGREHAGVILSVQLPPGELLKQVERLLVTLSAEEEKNTARWLQEFRSDS
jgi:predicted nuclease of predicted toxin-antitoxin system